MWVSCPDPTSRVESPQAHSRHLQNLANFPTMTGWINALKVPIGQSLEFEDLSDVRPLENKAQEADGHVVLGRPPV